MASVGCAKVFDTPWASSSTTPADFTRTNARTGESSARRANTLAGWTTDRRGYRYTKADPMTGTAWPAMPSLLEDLAGAAALAGGFPGFKPDACLVNRYAPGARLTLHQDKNEKDFDAPIVSVSLGMTATFLFGGLKRADGTMKIPLHHGDVVVWGGEDRLRFHGVMTLKGQAHSSLGHERINLTFRKAG